MQLLCNQVLASTDVKFGTSGARGLVSSFTPSVCAAFSVAFARAMQQQFTFGQVLIAMDNRPSSQDMAAWCAASLQALGLKVTFYGVVPTPALAFMALKQKVPAIMVTGSHIPFDRNGLKFYTPEGEISKEDEVRITTSLATFTLPKEKAPLWVSDEAARAYVGRYVGYFAPALLQNLRIGVYQHSSAGRDLYTGLFEALGARVIALGRSDDFVPIDTEAVSEEDEARARLWVREHQLDALFSTDGDGDRPLVADETGRWLRGDVLGLLAAKALGISHLAVPVSSSTAIERSGFFKRVVRTKIGSPYVIAEFAALEKDSPKPLVAGFEANGGFLLASALLEKSQVLAPLPTRDAVLPFLALMQLRENSGVKAPAPLSSTPLLKVPLSHVLGTLPSRFTASDRLTSFAQEKSQALVKSAAENPAAFLKSVGVLGEVVDCNEVDGVRLTLQSGDIVHLRPSGNAPELRCYAEASTNEEARALVATVLSALGAG